MCHAISFIPVPGWLPHQLNCALAKFPSAKRITKNHSFVDFLNWNLYCWVYEKTYYFSLYFFSRGSPSLPSRYEMACRAGWEDIIDPFTLNSQKWLALSARRSYVDRSWYDSKFFYLPFTKMYPQGNRQIWCLHCLFDNRFTGFFNNIMQTRNLTADSKLLNWSFDSMRICCLFHTRLRQINPKTGTKNVHKVLYNWFNLSLNHKKNTIKTVSLFLANCPKSVKSINPI